MFNKKSVFYTPTYYFKGFSKFQNKLKIILAENPNTLTFTPCKEVNSSGKNGLGILVSGKTVDSIDSFNKFFSLKDIDFHYEMLNRRLDFNKKISKYGGRIE